MTALQQHVLILEDDQRLAKSIARDFEDHGYKAELAESIAAIPSDRVFDFAVIDLRLGAGEFGLHAIDRIREKSPHCRILVLSGYASVVTAVEALKKGVIDYLKKPASFKQIEAALLGKKLNVTPEFKTPSLSQVEHEHIDFVLTKNAGNISQTAKELGLHRQSLQRKLKKYI